MSVDVVLTEQDHRVASNLLDIDFLRYDNEMGYSYGLCALVSHVGKVKASQL